MIKNYIINEELMTRDQLDKIFKGKKQQIDKHTGKVKQKGFISTTFEEFITWFNEEDFNKGCHYCGTKNERCLELFTLRPDATRGRKKRAEIRVR